MKANYFNEDEKTNEYTDYLNAYLEEFGKCFEQAVTMLLSQHKESDSVIVDPEVLHHARNCNELLKNYSERPKFMEKVP